MALARLRRVCVALLGALIVSSCSNPDSEKIRHMQRGDPPFSALSNYDAQDKLIVKFGE